MSTEFVKALAIEQRKRLVGSLMEHVERHVYPHLTQPQQKALRDKVMQSVGSYHDVVLDMLKASVNDGSMVNEHALELLADLSRKVDRIPGVTTRG
jgi:hypothetical protein